MSNRFSVLAALVAAAVSFNAFADEANTPEAKLEAAKAAFAERATLSRNSDAIARAAEGLALNPTGDVKYDLLIIASRAQYYKGTHVDGKDARMDAFGKGQALGEQAIKLNDDYAEGYYYAAINLGRWAEAKGIFESLSKKDELIAFAEGAESRLTRDADEGEKVDSFGPARTLGRVYFKLPGVAGGSRAKSLKYLEKAFNQGKENALNVVYYAETLADGNGNEKALAKKILDELLTDAKHPARVNADRAAETADELVLARDLRNKLGR